MSWIRVSIEIVSHTNCSILEEEGSSHQLILHPISTHTLCLHPHISNQTTTRHHLLHSQHSDTLSMETHMLVFQLIAGFVILITGLVSIYVGLYWYLHVVERHHEPVLQRLPGNLSPIASSVSPSVRQQETIPAALDTIELHSIPDLEECSADTVPVTNHMVHDQDITEALPIYLIT
jgi:hypothetical protein